MASLWHKYPEKSATLAMCCISVCLDISIRVCEGAEFVLFLNNADARVSVYRNTAALFVLQSEQV